MHDMQPTVSAIAACVVILAGCSSVSERTIVTGTGDITADVEARGGQILNILGDEGSTVVALLTRAQAEQLERQEELDTLHIGAVVRRISLPDGTALLDYRNGDLQRAAAQAAAPSPGGTIVYVMDGGTSTPAEHTGPQLHPETGARCTRHGDLVHGIVNRATQGRSIRTVDIKVLCSKVDREAVLHALYWIAANHPEETRGIANASFTLPDGPDLDKAIDALQARDIALVWAAGNRSYDICDGRQTPLHPHVTVVGAATAGKVDPMSNYGDCVNLWVSGTHTGDCNNEGLCLRYRGTSIAAPRLAAVLANMWEAAPNLSSEQLVNTVVAGASPDNRFGPWAGLRR